MNVTKLRRLSTEIFKTLNNINPAFMNEFSGILIGQFEINTNLENPIIGQVTFGVKIIRYLEPKTWNSLPSYK